MKPKEILETIGEWLFLLIVLVVLLTLGMAFGRFFMWTWGL